MKTISQRIKEGMEMRGMRQSDLFEKTGISKGALSSYISGRYCPKQNNIFLIASALDVNEAWLMGADISPERHEVHPTIDFVLNDLEKQIVTGYRKADDITQAMVLRVLAIDEDVSGKEKENLA